MLLYLMKEETHNFIFIDMAKDSKQILEEVVTRVVQKTIKEELKPIKALFFALLKEQVKPISTPKTEQKTVNLNTNSTANLNPPKTTTNSNINPVLQSLLEQTTPFTGEGPSVIQEGVYQPVSAIDAVTNDLANVDYSKFMKKVDEKVNNNFRP
jgi:hypothetical protein